MPFVLCIYCWCVHTESTSISHVLWFFVQGWLFLSLAWLWCCAGLAAPPMVAGWGWFLRLASALLSPPSLQVCCWQGFHAWCGPRLLLWWLLRGRFSTTRAAPALRQGRLTALQLPCFPPSLFAAVVPPTSCCVLHKPGLFGGWCTPRHAAPITELIQGPASSNPVVFQ